jgi:hypothetical protein
MEPVVAIVWVGVVVFAGTSAIALLYLVGAVPKMRTEHGSMLFKVLITEIVVASVAAFGYYIHAAVRADPRLHLPVSNLMLVEQDRGTAVHDGKTTLHIKTTDVGRSRREVDVKVDTSPDFSAPTSFRIAAGKPHTIDIGKEKYRFSFTQMGTIDPDPAQKQAKNTDFAFFTVSKEPK